jgi:hypothetical protein
VLESGRDARIKTVAPVSHVDAAGIERADVHALAVRIKQERLRRESTRPAELAMSPELVVKERSWFR